jgi:hypothetical protein
VVDTGGALREVVDDVGSEVVGVAVAVVGGVVTVRPTSICEGNEVRAAIESVKAKAIAELTTTSVSPTIAPDRPIVPPRPLAFPLSDRTRRSGTASRRSFIASFSSVRGAPALFPVDATSGLGLQSAPHQ